MARAAEIVAGMVCLGCLLAPIAFLLAGGLDEVVEAPGGGIVVQTRNKGARQGGMAVQTTRSGPKLSVGTANSGKRFKEVSGDDLPTTSVTERAHHPAHEIPVAERATRGLPAGSTAGE